MFWDTVSLRFQKMVILMENVTEYRYERKYLVKVYSVQEVCSLLKLHPAVYLTAYPPRYVNSVYFDTPGFRNYNAHVNGEFKRTKIRIRWYGEHSGLVQNPVLEQKEKTGDAGIKRSYPLLPLMVDNGRADWSSYLEKNQYLNNAAFKDSLFFPVIFIRYFRYYYISSDLQCRLTIDTDVCYRNVSGSAVFKSFTDRCQNVAVVELKYSVANDAVKYEPGTLFGTRTVGYSKYLNGVVKFLSS